MAVSAQRIIVSTTAVALNASDTGGARLLIKNLDGSNDVELGAASVIAGGGFPLMAGMTVAVSLNSRAILSAVRSTGSDVVVAVLRT